MISLFKAKINISSDNLQSAIVKKSNNKSLSSKTLDKLVKITNTQYEFKNGEAELIFRDKPCINNANTKKISKLIKDIKNIQSIKDNSFIKSQIVSWETNAKQLLEKNSEPKKIKQLLGQGSRGSVYKDGDSILKKTKNLTPNEISHEANMCNEYNLKKGSSQNVATIVGKCIKMPFMSGKTPDTQDTLTGVNSLFQAGFLMGDASPSNFLKTVEGGVEPVDFGLVFKHDELECIDNEVKKNIVSDYIKGGFRYIPNEIKKDYNSCIKKLDNLLGKDSPTRKMNIKVLSKVGF
ncbi:hypothetical protein [Iodobacter fluviatilis]|uniref:Protein kinase domain-containing protein n=1 Tax=Iodobacter fluviatilis TaxID=537 RepID=A0A7G3G6A5_9NEIS|nr:hypothetical protein [Iodobacter fluviatilis]QBC42679.1 hypothetical protein C1H71_03305 [Iodobacter fluviatilis]